MTPHPPSDHPGLDELADLAEELLPPERAESVHRHLADCPSCAEDYAALCGLPELLADSPVPPMPAEVADRLTAALAAESAARTEARAGARPPEQAAQQPAPRREAAATGPARTGGPAGTPRAGAAGPGRSARRRRGPVLLLTAAFLAVAAATGGILLNLDRSGGDATASSAAAENSSAENSSAKHPALGAGSPNAAATTGTAPVAADGPEFTADRLPAQVRQLLDGKNVPQLGAADPTVPAVPSCLPAAAGHPGEPPLAAAPGRYAGRPVLALVYRPAGGGGPLDVYLATPDCPGSTILLHSTVPAP
ncbi:hypothetical protein ACIQBJ_10180 [Kitasatospora sp. NPDC088391]|uniref:hypothetical protein n=1 Tax=Kitasatospora sp. NPDC088391 TaxID=3364074 RepID=UPI0037FCFD2B